MRNILKQLRSWHQRVALDLRVLRRLFPWRVGLALMVGVAILAALFQAAYHNTKPPEARDLSYVKAVYAVLNMAAFQVSFADMPPAPELDIFFVAIPLVSIPLLLVFGANLFHVIRVFFVRGERGQMWQRALVATVPRPIVVCGLGHVGYRVARQMLDLQQPVVGIDTVSTALTDHLIELDMPVIFGDVREVEVLKEAGAERASTVIVCTHDDMTNIEAAFHARELNPEAEIVLRLFEDEIADDIAAHFDIKAVLSRSAIAAQTFAYAALGLETLETFSLGDATYVLAEVPLSSHAELLNQTVGQMATALEMTVVCLFRDGELTLEPAETTVLRERDAVFVFTNLENMARLTEIHRAFPGDPQQPHAPVVVCGLGHTGYRVVNALRALNYPVIAVDFEPGLLAERLRDQGMPVHYGDFRQDGVLREMGIEEAVGIILCTEDDMVNFQAGIRAHALTDDLRVVMRVFEEPLGQRLREAFEIDAVYSTSAIAAPAFVAAALNVHLTHPVNLGGKEFLVGRMKIETLTRLYRETIGALTREPDLTVLLHKRDDEVVVPPRPTQRLRSGDEIVVLATREKLRELTRRNRGVRGLRKPV